MGKVLAALLLGALASHAPPAMSATTADAEAPVVTLVTGQRSGNGTLVMAAATDNVGVVVMHLYVNDELRASSMTGTIYYGWANVAPGRHTLRITATDAASNTATVTGTIRVRR